MNAAVKPIPPPSIIAALADHVQFIVYNRATKTPVHPEKHYAIDAQDRANWLRGDLAWAWAQMLGPDYGAGIVLYKGCGVACVDIDKAHVNGEWSPLATELHARFAGAYAEVSQSGNGLHIFFSYRGEIPQHKKKNTAAHIEFYDELRFIGLTGTLAAGDVSYDATHLIPQLIADYFPPSIETSGEGWTTEPAAAWNGPADDAELIKRARAARSPGAIFGAKASFADLWDNNVDSLARAFPPQSAGKDYDASSADQSLANHFAFWTGSNCERMHGLMLQSGLVRSKWDRDDYLRGTILKACARQTTYYKQRAAKVPAAVPLPPNEAPVSVATAVQVEQVLLAGELTKSKSGVIHGTVRNAVVYLQGIPWMREVFYDEFSQRIYYQGEEWSPTNETPQLLAVQSLIPAMSPATFAAAVEAVALAQRRDRLKDWIDTLPPWDGKKRLTLWLKHAFGCPADRYHMRVGRSWLISMIARGKVPGVKVDTMPVLEGVQGALKSTALGELAKPFYLEAPGVKFGDRDFLMSLRGAWLIEIPELSGLRAADVETVKATISKRVDRYRAPYARREADHPRRSVLSGSVNEADYLRDTTGNRRFLPIHCPAVNIEWIRDNREQLFAEALVAYEAGRSWWHFPKGATAEAQEDRLPVDPWASLIKRWLVEHGKGTDTLTSDNLHMAAGVLPERRSRATETRLGQVMKKSFPEWRKTRLRVPGSGERIYFWRYDGGPLSLPPSAAPGTAK